MPETNDLECAPVELDEFLSKWVNSLHRMRQALAGCFKGKLCRRNRDNA
jgi:hypothetical protein